MARGPGGLPDAKRRLVDAVPPHSIIISVDENSRSIAVGNRVVRRVVVVSGEFDAVKGERFEHLVLDHMRVVCDDVDSRLRYACNIVFDGNTVRLKHKDIGRYILAGLEGNAR